jgi:hypothetical protein
MSPLHQAGRPLAPVLELRKSRLVALPDKSFWQAGLCLEAILEEYRHRL